MTLQEIKDQITNERHWPSFDNLQDKFQLQLWPEVCRRAQLECARETLEAAAENVQTVETDIMTDKQYFNGAPAGYDTYLSVDKASITNEANIKLIQ